MGWIRENLIDRLVLSDHEWKKKYRLNLCELLFLRRAKRELEEREKIDLLNEEDIYEGEDGIF